jgi:hypothetical protein
MSPIIGTGRGLVWSENQRTQKSAGDQRAQPPQRFAARNRLLGERLGEFVEWMVHDQFLSFQWESD